VRKTLFACTLKFRCVRLGSRLRDVSQRETTQRGAERPFSQVSVGESGNA